MNRLAFNLISNMLLGTALVAALAAGQPAPSSMTPKPHAPGSPAALIAAHDCWTGEAPAGVEIPGHVVVTLPGHDAPTYGGPRLVGQALDQLFGDVDHGLDVHAFCK